jgi:hypothetical protein
MIRPGRDERGSMTLWVLGLSVSVLFLGGLGVDLWRVIELRRSLSATADATATAGANGLDDAALRRGETRLDPRLAERLAEEQLAIEGDADRIDRVEINADAASVEVELVGTVEFSLLGIFVTGDPIEVHVRAAAEPERSG